ncbi:hypothetical protein FCIRC_3752 [Fusarium circinatum]|uniref:Uncharacterized protein n=1 Tax=Fusarium circinatum TaxID=48490 RepID=A0A8H5X2I1_FUSCI|nr:hypothetical protein FCIRC_3752 [Fusarium circinatum]
MIIKLKVFDKPTIDRATVSEAGRISSLDLISLVIEKLKLAADEGRFSIPRTFHPVLGRLQSRCIDSYWRLTMGQNEMNETIKPLMNLQVQESSREKQVIPPAVHQGCPMPQQQVLGLDYLAQTQPTEHSLFLDPSISLDDCFSDAAASAGVEVLWNKFFTEELLPPGTE